MTTARSAAWLLGVACLLSGCGTGFVPLNPDASALLEGEAVAVAYSGYRAGQYPDRGKGANPPSDAELLEDLQILVGEGFRLIRLYDASGENERVLGLIDAHKLPIKVMLGAWLAAEVSSHETCEWLDKPTPPETLAANRKANAAQVDSAIRLANQYPNIVVAVNVGNEALVTWNDHLVTVDSLLAYARKVKAAIQQPVTTADNYVVFREQGRRLAQVLDFFAVHTYPVWEGKTIEQAAAYTIENLQSVRDAVPGVPLAIGEAGWPDIAVEFGPRASPQIQKRYVEWLAAWSARNNMTTFLFEAFDEDWKGHLDNPDGAEKHWGLFYIDRKPKPVMQSRARPLTRPSLPGTEE